MKLLQCKRGHNTTDPNSRSISGTCKECKNTPEAKGLKRIDNFNRNLKRLGWTPELWNKRTSEQGNVCAIGGHLFSKDNPPCADHAHIVPPKARGILCRKHNAALGVFEDNVEELLKAIDYLKFWNKKKQSRRPSMTKFFLTLLLTLSLSCGHKAKPVLESKSPIEQQHSTTHRVGVYEQFEGDPDVNHGEAGHCSGTSVGYNSLLTAQHCFKDSNLIRIDDEQEPTKIVAALVDGNDHVIYILDHEFSTWSNVVQRDLVVKESVFFWGAPGHNSDVYRTGYFLGNGTVEEVTDTHFSFQKFILPVFRGDSGSGIFDEQGNVIAVVSMADESATEISEPLQFTSEQLNVIKHF